MNGTKIFQKQNNSFKAINLTPIWKMQSRRFINYFKQAKKITHLIYNRDCSIDLLMINFFCSFIGGRSEEGNISIPSTFDGNNYSLAESQGGKIFYAANNTYFCGY